MSTNALIWPGSASFSSGNTPFGIYDDDLRPVIEMGVNFRGLEFKRVRFNLVDRSKNTYPILLGARFLKRARVSVNPNKTFVLVS
jgi:hypothetical protein